MLRIEVVSDSPVETVNEALNRALAAVHAVEAACSRFDKDSELSRLVGSPTDTSVNVSPILFQCLQFACEVAQWTDGRFDPTIAARMEQLGFGQHYLTGEAISWEFTPDRTVSFRDIELNSENQTVCLHRPLRLDLGAVAKGMAVDLAVQELSAFDFDGFVIDAGGDLYAAGTAADGGPWKVGIRHPLEKEKSIRTLKVQNAAVCTSGTYERRSPKDSTQHHILNAHDQQTVNQYLSLTAVGPYTMMADAFSTAAFLYAPDEALQLIEEVGLEGLVVTTTLNVQSTSGMEGYWNEPI